MICNDHEGLNETYGTNFARYELRRIYMLTLNLDTSNPLCHFLRGNTTVAG